MSVNAQRVELEINYCSQAWLFPPLSPENTCRGMEGTEGIVSQGKVITDYCSLYKILTLSTKVFFLLLSFFVCLSV